MIFCFLLLPVEMTNDAHKGNKNTKVNSSTGSVNRVICRLLPGLPVSEKPCIYPLCNNGISFGLLPTNLYQEGRTFLVYSCSCNFNYLQKFFAVVIKIELVHSI